MWKWFINLWIYLLLRESWAAPIKFEPSWYCTFISDDSRYYTHKFTDTCSLYTMCVIWLCHLDQMSPFLANCLSGVSFVRYTIVFLLFKSAISYFTQNILVKCQLRKEMQLQLSFDYVPLSCQFNSYSIWLIWGQWVLLSFGHACTW